MKPLAPVGGTVRAPTIYEVADRANVSIKTVSRVLNGEASVRPAMQQRVLAAVSELGYRPKMSARGLAGGRSYTLVTFLDERLTMDHWRIGRSNPYVERLQFAGMLQCRKSGYHLLVELLDPNSPRVEQWIGSTLSALNPDGVILTPPISENEKIISLLEQFQAPFARLSAAPSEATCLTISMDEVAAAADATNHLIDLGHKRIGFISGGSNLASSALREQGYRSALQARGIAIEKRLTEIGDYTFEGGKRAAAVLLKEKKPPTAIFASNDEMALGAMHEATRRGLAVPRDLSIIGFDNFPAAQYSIPPLTSMRQSIDDMGVLAVTRLIENAAQRGAAMAKEHAVVPHELVVRASTCPPPQAPSSRRTKA